MTSDGWAGAAERRSAGTPYVITGGGYEAHITSIGATLRALTAHGRDIILPFDEHEMRPSMQGAVLAPWPNRIEDGTYEFDGTTHHLPLTEPELHNAAHGLVAWQKFRRIRQSDNRLRLRAHVEPQPGYPWRIRIDVDFQVDDNGFRQTISAVNESRRPAPIGLGAHPYAILPTPGGELPVSGAVDAWQLTLPADEVLLVSEHRLLPTRLAMVRDHAGGSLDFRRSRTIGSTELNHAFTGLRTDERGLVTVRVADESAAVEMSMDLRQRWVQVYSSDAQPEGSRRQGLAIEPMTCPPDAFNSGVDLVSLAPGARTDLNWGMRLLAW